MIKNLLYKDLRMNLHPSAMFFVFLGAMLLIPNYPYSIIPLYPLLGIFTSSIYARENRDLAFISSLPASKSENVKARCLMMIFLEFVFLIFAVPFAALGIAISPFEGGNPVFMNATPAYFGLVFMEFAIFNVIFLPSFYRSAYKAGKSFILAIIPSLIFILAADVSTAVFPQVRRLIGDFGSEHLPFQLCVLFAGVVIFAGLTFAGSRKACSNFERVDL